jgi:pSer/pThr/pTyr-binding forkhead associated (FHA) protein
VEEIQDVAAVPEETQNHLLLATEKKVFGFDLLETFRVAIGRHDSNHLCFNSSNLSKYHAEILNEAEGLVLRDLGSTNGTYVNEERGVGVSSFTGIGSASGTTRSR